MSEYAQLRAGAVPCQTMADVRTNIDRVDRALVTLLAERLSYIEQAGHIKPKRTDVRDMERVADVLAKVEVRGQDFDLPPDYLRDIFTHLIEWSIAYEYTVFDDSDPNS